MRATTVAAACAIGTVAFYVLWVVTAADDYDGGLKHVAALVTAVLDLACLLGLVGSLALIGRRRWVRRR
jgi:hypothetical protein